MPLRQVSALVIGLATALVLAPLPAASIEPAATVLISATSAGGFLGAEAHAAGVSSDGSRVAFLSSAADLPGANGFVQLYVRDVRAGTTSLVSVADGGTAPANSNVVAAAFAADGSAAAFVTDATNLSGGFLTFGRRQAYVRILASGVTAPMSFVDGDPTKGSLTDVAQRIALSGDGSVVAFATAADLLPAKPAGGVLQVYLRTVPGGALQMVSTDAGGTPAPQLSTLAGLSPNGKWALFASAAPYAGLPTGAKPQLYLRDLTALANAPVLVTARPDGTMGLNEATYSGSVADDGSVAFTTTATDTGFPAGAPRDRVYLRAHPAGQLTLVSHLPGQPGTPTSGAAITPVISADAARVAFVASDQDVVGGMGAVGSYVFSWRRADGSIEAVSRDGSGAPLGPAAAPFSSGDGTAVAFDSSAPGLVAGGDSAPSFDQVYLRDLRPAGVPASGPSGGPAGGSGPSESGQAQLAATGAAVPAWGIGGLLAAAALAAGLSITRRTSRRRGRGTDPY